MGKSRLAAQVAAQLLPTYADGVWICPLGVLEVGQDVVPTIADTLGLSGVDEGELHGVSPLDLIKTYLHERERCWCWMAASTSLHRAHNWP
ncbi:MAG: hypothetical protein HC853_07420 [Anaerolineae bacterium]|nr:hypothetical protein [Anaerolineae bacterium]